MKRREFITLLAGAAAIAPPVARAQQSERMRRIAVLMNNAEDDPEGQARAAAFRQGLQARGWTEGKNLRIDWYWTAGDVGRIRGDVTELAGHPPDIIVANGRVTLSEAVQVIRSIPIVFVLLNDPVGQGFISSLARPGGNVTGFTFFEYAMFGKSLELLKKVAPAVTRVGFIFNPDMSAYYGQFLPAFETDARQYSIELTVARVGTEAEIDAAVAKLAAAPGGRPDGAAGCLYLSQPRADRALDGAPPDPRDLFLSTTHQGRRFDVVRAGNVGHLPALSFVHRSHLEGGQPGRASGASARQI
jgi:putative tryptophan/tyrosine transport system substrate-binding protein